MFWAHCRNFWSTKKTTNPLKVVSISIKKKERNATDEGCIVVLYKLSRGCCAGQEGSSKKKALELLCSKNVSKFTFWQSYFLCKSEKKLLWENKTTMRNQTNYKQD
jgi:hypothetical protein